MRTVKQVSDLTGISVRMLHHYHKIGLFKPSKFTEAGYRLYDDKALETLQQILFFKELDLPLKEIKEIMDNPSFDKRQALENQKKLLILKRNRLNDLIELVNKTLKGENAMSFKEFDMSEYFNVLEELKKENEDMIALAEQYDGFKKDCLEDKHPELKELYKKLVSDLTKDPSSKEIQKIAEEISHTARRDYEIFKMDKGDDHWYYMVQNYLLNPGWIKEVDKKYGNGACKFIGEVLKIYLGDKQPKINILYKNLTSDLSKDPSSNEIQQIIKEIAEITKKQQESLKLDMGDNYFGFTADLYLSNPEFMKAIDKQYGSGASKFIGEALKFYSENN